MADNLNEEKNLREEINNLIKEYIELLKQAGVTEEERVQREKEYNKKLEEAQENQERLNGLNKELTTNIELASEAVKAMGVNFESVSQQLSNIVDDLGNSGDLGRRVLSTFRNLRDVTDKIRDDRDLTRVLTIKQLKAEQEGLGVLKERMNREVTRGLNSLATESNINKLRNEGNDLAAEALTTLGKGGNISREQLDALRESQGVLTGLEKKDRARVLEAIAYNKVIGENGKSYEVINAQIQAAIDRENQLNKTMGLTGVAVEALGKLPGLGMVFRVEDVEEVKKAAREALVEQNTLLEQASQLTSENIELESQIIKLRLEAKQAVEEGNYSLAQEKLNLRQNLAERVKINKSQIETNNSQVETLKLTSKGSVAMELFKKSAANLASTLNDPVVILAAIGKALMRNSQLTNDFQQELGVSYGNALAMRNALSNAAGASGDLFINSEKLQKSFFALKETTGVFFDISSQSAETFTNLTERIGLAGAEAGNLTTLMRLQGKETETTLGNLYDTTGAMLQTSKTTATVKDILGDVAKASKGLQASLAANPQALAKAAIAAREFGSTLSELEGIQKNLLNFESSIEAELKAELLTGKQLNLEKARAAALNNDMKTLGEELKKQNVDLASFGKMNVLQQEAIAEAMGMNRDSLAETLLKQEMQGKTLEEIRSTMGEQAYEQAKALSAQDKFNAAVAKVKDLFENVMTALTPVIDVLAAMLQPIAWVAKWLGKLNELTGGWSNALIGVAIAAKALGMSFGSVFNPATYTGFFKGISKNVGSLSFGGIKDKIAGAFAPGSTNGFFSGIKGKFKGLTEPLKGLKDKLIGAFSGTTDKAKGIQFDPRMAGGGRFRDMTSGRMVSKKVANAAGVFKPGGGPAAAAAGAAGKASSVAGKLGKTAVPPDTGIALRLKMHNIAKGIASFANPQVLLGGLYMIASAPGLIALGLASLPLKITEKLNGIKLMTSMQGIALGVASFASASAGILPLIGAAGALAILTLGLPGLAGIALLGVPAAAGMTALGAGLATLGAVAATGLPFLGVALIGALGAALIPFGIALAATAPLVTAVGTAIAGTLTAIAGAVTTVLPALTTALIDLATKIPLDGLLGLSLALPGLALGVGLLGVTLLTSAPGLLVGSLTLPLIAPALAELNTAIAGIDGASFLAFSAGILVLGTGLLTSAPGFIIGAFTLPLLAPALTQLSEAISGIDGGNFALFSVGMIGLAAGLSIMGAALPFVLAGIGAFTLFGAALNLAAPGIEAAGNAIAKVGNSIANIGNAIANVIISVGAGIVAIGRSISDTVSSLTDSLIKLVTGVPLPQLLSLGLVLPILGAGLAMLGGSILLAAPGLLAGALILPMISASLATIPEVNGENLLMVGAGIAALAGGFTLLGVAAPLALAGAGVLSLVSLALIPLGAALSIVSPTLDVFTTSIQKLGEVDGGNLIGLAAGIGALGLVVSGLAVMSPLIIIGSGALAILGLSMSNAAESMKSLADVSSDSMIGFAKSITILGGAAALMGSIAPLVAIGSGAIYLLGNAIAPAAEAMKNLAGISADSMVGFAAAIGILGQAAAGMGILAPLVALGAGTIYLLGKAIVPAAEAMQNLIGISADSMIGFSVALNLLGNAAAGMGLLAPLVVLGAGAMTVLGMAIVPAAEAMKNLAGISADAILAFTFGLSQLSTTTALIGAFAPVIALGTGAIFLLGKAIAPAAEAMKNLAGISADAILGFSTGLSMLGSTASMLGIVAPLVVLGAGALYVLGNALVPAAEAFAILEGLNASTILGFAGALTILGTAAALFGALSPAILLGAGALYVLGNAIVPAAEAFKLLEGLDPAVMTGFANSLFVLGSSAAFFGGLFPLVLLGAGAIAILGLALSPLAELAPKLNLTNTALAGIAGSIGLLGTSLAGLDTSKLTELAEFGESINITANVGGGTVGGISPVAAQGTPALSSPETTTAITTTTETKSPDAVIENLEPLIAATVTSTIKALVPEMVAAMGNVKVVNDNFHNSKQSEGPSRNRQITNNNFA